MYVYAAANLQSTWYIGVSSINSAKPKLSLPFRAREVAFGSEVTS